MIELKTPIPSDVKNELLSTSQLKTFEMISSVHKRDYIKWIDEAKQPKARARRIKRMCAMLAAGKKTPNA